MGFIPIYTLYLSAAHPQLTLERPHEIDLINYNIAAFRVKDHFVQMIPIF